MKWLLATIVLGVYILHQDFWFWKDHELVFGILPIGLAYHAAYCVLASFTLWVLVQSAWPKEIEDSAAGLPERPAEDPHG